MFWRNEFKLVPFIILFESMFGVCFWTNLAFACKTETLGSQHNHALLILTKSSKSKNQVVHEPKFKDILSSTCLTSSERRRVLDLESEVN